MRKEEVRETGTAGIKDGKTPQKNSQHKYFINFFGDMHLKRVDTATIEVYFLYCQNDIDIFLG